MSSGMIINYPTQSVVTMIPAMTPQQNQTFLSKFLKGEPKALGTVQIMIGVVTLLFGIVSLFLREDFIFYSGFTFWGSFIYISAGAVSAAAANKTTSCLIKASLTINVICAVTTGIGIILLSINTAMGYYCHYEYRENRYGRYDTYGTYGVNCENARTMFRGSSGVLLVLSLMQFIISIVISAFGCQVTCGYRPTHMYMMSNQQAMQNPMMQNPTMQNPTMQNPMVQNPIMQGALMQGTVLQYTQAMPQMTAPQSSTGPLGEPSFSAPLLCAPPPYSSVPPCSQKKL